MSQVEQEQLTGKLAIGQAYTNIKGFMARITKAFQAKGLTLAKILRMYTIAEKAVKDIEAVIAEK